MWKVVVVEDETLVKRGLILTTDWQKFHCEVIGQASNGIEGLQVIKQTNPDIVIADVRMPGMDGLHMVEQMRSNSYDTEVIIITGYNEFEYAHKAIRLDVCDFLMKPIDDEDFENAMNRVCELLERKKKLSQINHQKDKDSKIMLFKEYAVPKGCEGSYTSRAVHYIHNNYKKSVTLKDVADSLYISESYLSRVFKLEAGQTFVDYLTYYRIHKACCFLKNPNIKIYEIADLVGYKDQRYFSSIFKKLVGFTPKEFREQMGIT